MKYLKFYDLEETYINNKSSLEYFNVSYTKDTDKTWVKEDEEEDYLLMKFKVEEAIITDDNNGDIHKVLTRKICNNLSVFKSIQIGNDEPINIEVEEMENIIDSNSFILNENDYFTSTYVPENNINGEQQCTLVINEQFTKDDYIVIFNRFYYDYPYEFYSISEAIEYGLINEINENTFDILFMSMSNEIILFVIKKEGAELLDESGTITSDMLQYIISSSLKYNEVKNKIYLPSVEGEYMVKGVLNQSIDSLNSLFVNNVYYEYTENTNIYDDIEINNDYDKNIINLIGINIPKQIYYLYNTFFDCIKLKEVNIDKQSNLTLIDYNTFSDCYSLTSFTIPNSVTTIGDYAFSNCTSLTSITIPNSVTYIGYGAFEGCESLTSITIPNSVTSIDDNTFNACYSLSEITIGNSVTSIGWSAFGNCFSLTSITIPNSVTTIDDYAFRDCDLLSEITIPNSVTSIGDSAFTRCHLLSEIICLAETAPTISSDTFNRIYSNGVLYYPQGSDYSSWLSTSNYYLGYYGWVGVELQNVYDFKVNFITNGVRVNSPYNSLVINGIQGVKQSDNSYLFSGLQPIDGNYKFDLIADGEVIDTIDIKHKNKWITVGDNSSMLTCVYNPCQKTTIYSGSNLSYSGAYVDGVYVGKLRSSYTFNDVSEHIIQYSDVNSIGNGAFYNCNSLNSITIPNSVTSIGNSAFSDCDSLSEIIIPNNVTSIGNNAFYYCYSLNSITIPSGVTSIGNYTFYNCQSLTSITIPNSVTSIGDRAFYQCTSLTSFTIPNSVISIGNSAFTNSYSLTSIDIPNNVTSIGDRAFSDCDSLSEITIGNSVTSIGNGAFSDCFSLSKITCLAKTTPAISSDTFNRICYKGVLYYPQGSDYSSWLSTDSNYLGYYNWTFQEI